MLIKLAQLLLALRFVSGSNISEKSDRCGPLDWVEFEDKCFKLLDVDSAERFINYEEASNLCAKIHLEATLPSIKSAGEQDFIANLTYSRSKIWLGGKVTNASITWDDESSSNFTNWSDYITVPQTGNFCILMGDANHAHGHGKWLFSNHGAKDLVSVLCQKPQTWAPSRLHKNFQKYVNAGEQKFQQFEQDALSLRNELNRFYEELSRLKRELEALSAVGPSNLIPIGFVYVQYKEQNPPSTIWPNFRWTEITSQYAGQFFRALGGSSGAFGVVQSGNAPRITAVEFQDHNTHPQSVDLQIGATSPHVMTGYYVGSSDHIGIAFTTSGGEVRPVNSAVKIWKRSA